MLRIPHHASQNWSAERVLAAVGLPSLSGVVAADRLRFLSQALRSGPDELFALWQNSKTALAALHSAANWLCQACSATSELRSFDDSWPAWKLFLTAPRRCKGVLKRASTWHVGRLEAISAFQQFCRGAWTPMPPEAVEVASAEHACLLCGIAFYDCHSWSAHAVRAHKFRSKAVRLAVGLRCRACGARFATLKRHQRHLINHVRCCQAVERDLDCLLPVDNSEPGHVQTVSEGAVAVDHLPAAGPEISVALLLRLRQEVFSSDCEIFAAVQSTVEPFPVLRNTLAEWIEGLPDTSLRAWAKDVLLCMQVDLHCQVASRVPRPRAETPDVFTPLLEPLPLCPAWNTAPVLLVGFDSSGLLPEPFSGNCAGAVSWHFWQGPPDSVDFSGLALRVPPPAAGSVPLWEPVSCSLRSLRQHLAWVRLFFAWVGLALSMARAGRPCHILFPCGRESAGPLAGWFENIGRLTPGRVALSAGFTL